MSEPLHQVTFSRTSSATVATIVGEVDISNAPELRAAITETIRTTTAPAVVLDLCGVTFLGSPGLAALIAADAQAAARGVQLGVVTGGNRVVLRPLQITGLDISIPMTETLTELEATLAGRSRESESPS